MGDASGNKMNGGMRSGDASGNKLYGGMRSGDASGNKMYGGMRSGDASGNKMYGGTRKMKKIPAVGTKAQVFHSTAKHTSGGLTKKDLMKTKKGRIVSRKKHALGKKSLKNLVKAGYKAKKGTFKLFKRS